MTTRPKAAGLSALEELVLDFATIAQAARHNGLGCGGQVAFPDQLCSRPVFASTPSIITLWFALVRPIIHRMETENR
jgi:hypothetical protein